MSVDQRMTSVGMLNNIIKACDQAGDKDYVIHWVRETAMACRNLYEIVDQLRSAHMALAQYVKDGPPVAESLAKVPEPCDRAIAEFWSVVAGKETVGSLSVEDVFRIACMFAREE